MNTLSSFFLIFGLLFTGIANSQTKSISDEDYYQMYLKASGKKTQIGDTVYQNYYYPPYYVVITVTDLKSGLTKEVCTDYNAIDGAIKKDSGNAIIDEKIRVFKFKSDEALRNIGFFHFSSEEMNKCLKDVTSDLLIEKWKEDQIKFMNSFSGDCQIYYAYLLFKNGIMSRRGSLVSSLEIEIDPVY